MNYFLITGIVIVVFLSLLNAYFIFRLTHLLSVFFVKSHEENSEILEKLEHLEDAVYQTRSKWVMHRKKLKRNMKKKES